MEASAPRYITPFCLTESQIWGDGRKRGKWERRWSKLEKKKKVWEVRRVIWFFISAGECTRSISGNVYAMVGVEVGEANLDVREMSDTAARLLGFVAVCFKKRIGVPEVCFAWLKHEQRALSSDWLICGSPPLSPLVFLPSCLHVLMLILTDYTKVSAA